MTSWKRFGCRVDPSRSLWGWLAGNRVSMVPFGSRNASGCGEAVPKSRWRHKSRGQAFQKCAEIDRTARSGTRVDWDRLAACLRRFMGGGRERARVHLGAIYDPYDLGRNGEDKCQSVTRVEYYLFHATEIEGKNWIFQQSNRRRRVVGVSVQVELDCQVRPRKWGSHSLVPFLPQSCLAERWPKGRPLLVAKEKRNNFRSTSPTHFRLQTSHA